MVKLRDLPLLIYHYVMTRRFRRWKSREELEAWQEKKVLKHLRKVRRSSEFYRELWNDIPLESWRDFPSIYKDVMMQHFQQLNTAGISKEHAFQTALEAERTREFSPTIGSVTVGLSSGTSGNRGLFLVGRRERLAWAGTVLAKILPGSLLGRHRIAFFLRANSNLYQSVGSRRLQFLFYDLLDPIEKHMEALHKQLPTLLVGPLPCFASWPILSGRASLKLSRSGSFRLRKCLIPLTVV
ncbi:hypothetical protein [Paenibacillus hexagrammi]|uniref:hypothetical protein n=1 Tax=Paenibacillus hexagrammi TaxID=2908839 RepID=UPI0028830C1D|nr:hypothetical protein [Paenibacillus sp. YPD9-1]